MLMCFLFAGCNFHEPVGIELTYAVSRAEPRTEKSDMQKVLTAVQRRVGLYGTAELVGDRVKVGIYGTEKKNVDRVKKLIAQAGVLEFRILADHRFDGKLVALAEEDRFAGQRDVRKKQSDEFPAAQWCPIVAAESQRLTSEKNLVTRNTEAGTVEALVVIDPYHVTGDDFTKVYPDTDRNGQPCVFFELSADGARRMRRLTSENVPAGNDPIKVRLLGILLDGQLQTAPSIRSAIGARGAITGKYSEQEAADVSVILSAGSLPVHLDLVNESDVRNQERRGSDEPQQRTKPFE